jgi:hypothetical protein
MKNYNAAFPLGRGIRKYKAKCAKSSWRDIVPFQRWLRSLLADEHLMKEQAKTSRLFHRYQTVLRQWQQCGFPHPGKWPKTYQMGRVCSFTREWIERHEKQGF